MLLIGDHIEADVFLCILERGFRKNIEQATKLSVGEISSSKPRIAFSISLFQVITLRIDAKKGNIYPRKKILWLLRCPPPKWLDRRELISNLPSSSIHHALTTAMGQHHPLASLLLIIIVVLSMMHCSSSSIKTNSKKSS